MLIIPVVGRDKGQIEVKVTVAQKAMTPNCMGEKNSIPGEKEKWKILNMNMHGKVF